MLRAKTADLINWKNSPNRKPLIIRGARQVGKTWLMKEFGKAHYSHTVYVNFEKNKRLKGLFADDFDCKRILIGLQAELGITVASADTLLIFDEIQAVPEAITALKYFQEEAGEYHIVAAGSLLGIALQGEVSFPVGKVSFMDLYPMSFSEFLEATGDHALVEILRSGDWGMVTTFKAKFIERLRQYYYVGGMPEAVLQFITNYNFAEVRTIQKEILEAYDQDFSKHALAEIVPRIRMIWNSIPAQLAKENRKFIYGLIKEGSRARDYELALSWLTDCGQVHKVCRVTKPGFPLKGYEDLSSFKIFLVDVGLLGAMVELDSRTVVSGNELFAEFKGALTEQYVFQQLKGNQKNVIFYWSAERSTAEVDFVIQNEGQVYPMEVKSEENLRAKSLKVYYEKFNPIKVIRASMSDYRTQEWLTNIPLYAISEI